MGKVVKKALPIAASIGISFIAPSVAPVFAKSMLGKAVIGAVAGGVSSAIAGGNPLQGALLGGLGGAVTGALTPASAGLSTTGPFGGGLGSELAAQSASLAGAPSAMPSFAGGITGEMAGAGMPVAAPTGALTSTGAAPVTAATTAASSPGFFGSLGDTLGKFVDPKDLVGAGGKFVAGLLTDAEFDKSGIPDALQRQQQQALRSEQEMNRALTAERLDAARDVMSRYAALDPDLAGQLAQQNVEGQILRRTREDLRGVAPGARQRALGRQQAIRSAAAGTGAFGEQRARTEGTQLAGLATGAGLIPTSTPSAAAGFTGLTAGIKTAEDIRRQRAEDTADIFRPFLERIGATA
jgi:hypothetical protein